MASMVPGTSKRASGVEKRSSDEDDAGYDDPTLPSQSIRRLPRLSTSTT